MTTPRNWFSGAPSVGISGSGASMRLAPQGFGPAAHHRLLIRELQAVADGVHDRLAVFMPPGSAKSTYTSDLFPPWFLAQGRDRRIIATSNTADLAGTFSRRVRGRIRSHGPTLGYRLEREAEDFWTTTNGGEYRAAGIGGVITGLRADLALIDDPVKSREEADSEARRNRIWDWFQDDLRTRLRPGAAIVVVQTRWHQDDLSGRLLETQRDQWRVVSLPAEAEADDPLGRTPGEMLWGDDAYGYAASLARVKAEASTRSWSALYQQRPVPDSGGYFQSDWLHRPTACPDRATLQVYGGSDYAVTAERRRLHRARGGRHGPGRPALAAGPMARAGRGRCLDRGVLRPGAAVAADRLGRGDGADSRRHRAVPGAPHARAPGLRGAAAFPTRGDKSVRAQSIRGRMALDGLHLPRHAPWRQALRGGAADAFRRASTTTKSTRWAWSGSCWTGWSRAPRCKEQRDSRAMVTGACCRR